MRLTHLLRAMLIAAAPLWAQGAYADADKMALASDCFQNNGGPQSCPMVFGWCSALWGIDHRLACSEQLYKDWDLVLNAEWQKLKSIAHDSAMKDRVDGTTLVWDRLLAEQRVWITWRDANCNWQMPVAEGGVRSVDEARFDCLTHMTRARSQQLWDFSYYMLTTDVP